jgi:hypothetical protein
MRFQAIADYLVMKYGAVNQLPDPQDQELEEPETKESVPVAEIEEVIKDKPKLTRPPTDKEIARVMKNAPSYEQIAQKPPDTSLGAPIAADRAESWKDKLRRVYNLVNHAEEKDQQLPFFQQLQTDMKGTPVLGAINDIVSAYTFMIGNADLKNAFVITGQYIDALNKLRDRLPSLVKDQDHVDRLNQALYRIQNEIWLRAKNVLNHHDIGTQDLSLSPKDKADMERIIGRPARGTWQYGPMKNPTKPLSQRQKRRELEILHPKDTTGRMESPSEMMRRLMRENKK